MNVTSVQSKSKYFYNFDNIPDTSIINSNHTTAAIAQDVALLVKHCHKKLYPNQKKMTILLIKSNIVDIDLELRLKEQFKNEAYEDYETEYRALLENSDIHYLTVNSVEQVTGCIKQLQQSLYRTSKDSDLPPSPCLLFIVGLDLLWDTEAFLILDQKSKISLLNNLFLSIRSLQEFRAIAQVKVIIALDEINNIRANKKFQFSRFIQMFYMRQKNVVLSLDDMRKEINRALYTNNILKQSQDY